MYTITNKNNHKLSMKKYTVIIFLISFITFLTACKDTDINKISTDDKYSSDIFAMDTYMSLTAYGSNAEESVMQAVHEIQRLDNMFSVGNNSSDVTILNNIGSSDVSDETKYLIETSIKISDLTNGCFDITIYPVMELWGFTDKNYKVPSESELNEILSHVDYNNIHISGNEIVLDNSARIDFGGIAKGYTSGRVIQLLREHGIEHAIINLGGNVQTLGRKPDGSQWRVAIQSPESDNEYIGILNTSDKAVITSGGYERYFEDNGNTYHHIIDPETGYPSDSNLTSVTIICDDGTIADAFSTSLFIMGLEKAVEFYKSSDIDFDMILLDKDNNIYITENIQDTFNTSYNYNVIKK